MILERLARLASQQPERPALQDAYGQLGYAELHAAVTSAAIALQDAGIHTLGLLLDNGPAWVIMDLAALHAGIRVVPLPTFFSRSRPRMSYGTRESMRCVQTRNILTAGKALHRCHHRYRTPCCCKRPIP